MTDAIFKINGWQQENRFFEVELLPKTYIDEDDVQGISSIFNCHQYAGEEYVGCPFRPKFALKTQHGAWVHPSFYYGHPDEYSVDADFIHLEDQEYQDLKDGLIKPKTFEELLDLDE
jgi:hypothetical protein